MFNRKGEGHGSKMHNATQRVNRRCSYIGLYKHRVLRQIDRKGKCLIEDVHTGVLRSQAAL